MATKTITLPSGLSGDVRNLKAKEMSTLADPANAQSFKGKAAKKARRQHPLDPVLAGCWLKTIDPGPYALGADGALAWGKVLLCDRFTLLVNIRALTWGAYEFKVRCQDASCPRSKKPFLWDLDLTQLAVKDLPEESRAKVKAGNLDFDIMVAGKACKFRLLTGADEINLPHVGDDVPSSKKMLAQTAARLFEVEGVTSDEDRIDWVGELDLPELYAVSRMMDAVDGGVETRTKVICPDCEEEQTVDVPFGETGFLAPTPT